MSGRAWPVNLLNFEGDVEGLLLEVVQQRGSGAIVKALELAKHLVLAGQLLGGKAQLVVDLVEGIKVLIDGLATDLDLDALQEGVADRIDVVHVRGGGASNGDVLVKGR
jgi:hypothetical protein